MRGICLSQIEESFQADGHENIKTSVKERFMFLGTIRDNISEILPPHRRREVFIINIIFVYFQ